MAKVGLILTLALAACASAPAGAPYRALGTEPFWSLEINAREMVFTEANAPGVRIVQPTPEPIHGVAGETYRTPRIHANLIHARCNNGMSDHIYPDRVQVRVDGRSLEGCGGEPLAGRTP